MRDNERTKSHDLIKQQFGANAAEYIHNKVHAKGESLTRLVALVKPQPHWRVLDIASAVGHTAFAFAPHVSHVWATDITPEMLNLARQEAEARGLPCITFEYAEAEALPYQNMSFDLVTCRIAPHHFNNVTGFAAEAARVLQPGGTLAVVDNIVPSGPAGDYVNAFEKLRDPSHHRCLTLNEWLDVLATVGFSILHHETLVKAITLESWAGRHDPYMQRYLRTMLTCAPPAAAKFLQPNFTSTETIFHLYEGLIVGRLADSFLKGRTLA